jgi:GT2 family glycosyltransferase
VMDLSIIIPVFNQLPFTKKMLMSLGKTLPENLLIELIIIDDASSDETVEWLNCFEVGSLGCPQIKSFCLLRNEQNIGYGKSSNIAVKRAHGDILALLNNDLVLKPGWLEPMLALFRQPLIRDIIVGNLQYVPDTSALDHAGFEVRIDKDSNRPVLEHLRECAFELPYKVFAVTGACCLIARQTFERLGGFDEEYINGGEDVDLCLRVTRGGGACWIVPDSSVWHQVSQSRGRHKERDEKNSWRLFKLWHKQIAKELERDCAEIVVCASGESPFAKRIAREFLDGLRSLAPIAIKVMAQRYVQTELKRLEERLHV